MIQAGNGGGLVNKVAGLRRGSRASCVLTPRWVMVVLMVALIALVFSTFRRYGFTSDDVHGFARASRILAFLSSGGADRAGVGKFVNANFYGAMPDLIALVLQKAFPVLSLDSRHLAAALFGVIGVFYVYRLGTLLGGRWTGPIAALLLTFNPMWLGYMFINIKDIPFATALLAASYHGLRVLGDERPPGRLSWVALAIWSGLLATIKLLGLPMLGVVVGILLAALLIERRRFDPRVLALRTLGAAVAVSLGSLLCAALFWPQLFLYTPGQVLQVVRTFLDYTPWHGRVLLNGATYPQDRVPRYYVLAYLVVSMPLFLQALFLSAAPIALRIARLRVLGLVAVPAAFLLVQAVTHSREYNGFRHFLFILPYMTVAAAFALAHVACDSRSRLVRVAGVGALIAFMGVSALGMSRLFPYQYSSYNLLVGGIEGAQGRFYVDVWHSAHREALGLLDRASAPGVALKVYSCGPPLDYLDYPRMQRVKKRSQADYVVALPRGCPVSKFPGLRTVAEVKRGNVLFASVLAPN